MAHRPIFIPTRSGYPLVDTKYVEFDWHPGLHIKQKRKSIEALHTNALTHLHLKRVLEISTKSAEPLGVALSAFNLTILTRKYHQTFSVEAAYQGSKVFERGGPFKDLFGKSAREAKGDPRLRQSGRLIGFSFLGVDWPLEPKTAFYDWLYINALRKSPDLVQKMSEYEAFSDIEFNPERSLNCQAYSAALLIALKWRGLLEESLSTKSGFLQVLGYVDSQVPEEPLQKSLNLAQELEHGQTKPSTKQELQMVRFDARTFQSWDALSEVMSVVESWMPAKSATEHAYERELGDFLVRELPCVDVTWKMDLMEFRADFVVADSVAVELKRDLDSFAEYDELLDRLKSMKDWHGWVIVLLVGKTNAGLVRALQAKVKTWHISGDLGAKVKVIRKAVSKSSIESKFERRSKTEVH